MKRIALYIIFGVCLAGTAATAAVRPVTSMSRYVNPQSYAYMYPYLNNQMRTELNPGTTVSMVNNPVDVIVRTTPMSQPRRVVPRPARTTSTDARAATGTVGATAPAPATQNTARRVVPRSANVTQSSQNRAANRSGTRIDSNTSSRVDNITTTVTTTTDGGVSTTRCMADYINCMNGYCARENTAYNRCYCSAKLSQIDSEYQPQIEGMVMQILTLRGTGEWSADEMNEYWMEKIGQYVGENSWIKLDNALNINWPTPDERVRGNAAFTIGHEYCVAHLRACGYMAQNLRDAYRSQISRDCTKYENSLMLIRNAAASMIEHYSN